MIKLIKSDSHVVEDILIQQKILYEIISNDSISSLTKNDTLFWDLQGFVSYNNISNIINFLNLGGRIIILPDENYKIFSRIESKIDDVWKKFIQLTNKINKKDQILVLIEGKIYQTNDTILCTAVQFGYFEYFDGFIGNHYKTCYIQNEKITANFGTAAFIKPTRIFRKIFHNKIKNTEIDTSQMLMPPRDINEYIDKFSGPDILKKSYCSIIHETDVDPYVSVISEKTIKTISLEKFWITLADCNYYNTMKFLGFDIFDDIFDLSFSTITDPDKRVDEFIIELQRMNSYDFKKLSNDLSERVLENKYNLARAWSIDYHHRVNTIISLLRKDTEV